MPQQSLRRLVLALCAQSPGTGGQILPDLGKERQQQFPVFVQRGMGGRRYRPDPDGSSPESYTGFWQFRGQHVRDIPQGSRIHRSVWDRMANPSNGYSPGNLLGRGLMKTVE